MSAALLEWMETAGARTVAALSTAAVRDHGRRLVPLVRDLLRAHDTLPGELGAVAVGRGPGTYTGVRVGIATALGLASAVGIPVYGVETLRAAAFDLSASDAARVAVVTEAGRGGLYAQAFRRADGGVPSASGEARRLDAPAAAAFVADLAPDRVLAVGPAAAAALAKAACPVEARPYLDAVAVGGLALALLQEGVNRHGQALAVAPIYLRPAATAAGA